MFREIVMFVGVFFLIVSLAAAVTGVVLVYTYREDDQELEINSDNVNQFAGCNFFLFNDSVLVGLSMVLGAIVLSLVGVGLILFGGMWRPRVKQATLPNPAGWHGPTSTAPDNVWVDFNVAPPPED